LCLVRHNLPLCAACQVWGQYGRLKGMLQGSEVAEVTLGGAMTYQVFDHARIFTADAAGAWAGALAVQGGPFAAVGPSEAVLAAAPPGAQVTALGGRAVAPGLIDAHNHFLQTSHCLTWIDARYPGTATVADLVRLIERAAAGAPAGSWIQAFGLDPA